MNTTTDTPSNQDKAMSELAQHARSYLGGYGRQNLARLQQLAQFDGWQRMAQAEIERRAYSLLQVFEPELLQAIAQGSIRIDHLAGEVAQDIASQSN